MSKKITKHIDAELKSIWLNKIPEDYSNRHLLKEDSLKNAFYYHLRSSLGELLEENDLRIFTEFNDAGLKNIGFRADLAIVKVPRYFKGYMGKHIEEVLAIIEFKFLSQRQSGINAVYKDVEKIKQYIKKNKFHECQYYLGVIHEVSFDSSNILWLDGRQTKNWADGCVTELGACYIDGSNSLCFTVTSYNHLNPHLSRGINNAAKAVLGV